MDVSTRILEHLIEEKEAERESLRYHVRFPEVNVALERKEVFDNINRRIDLLSQEIQELENILAFIEDHEND